MRIESRVPLPPRSNGHSRRGSSPPLLIGSGGGVSVWTIRQEREGSDLHPHVYLFITFMCFTMLKKIKWDLSCLFLCRHPHPFPQKTAKLDRCSVLIAIEQWGLFSWPTTTVTHETRKADALSASRTRHIHTWGPFKTGCNLKPKSVTKPENQSKLRFSKGILI